MVTIKIQATRVGPIGSTVNRMLYRVYLRSIFYCLNSYLTIEEFNIQFNIQLNNSITEGLNVRHCFDLVIDSRIYELSAIFSTYLPWPARKKKTSDPKPALFKVKAHS